MSNGNPKCGNFSCSGSSVFALGNKLSNDWGLFLEIDHSPVTIIIPLGERNSACVHRAERFGQLTRLTGVGPRKKQINPDGVISSVLNNIVGRECDILKIMQTERKICR
jgi:hypothetical protein